MSHIDTLNESRLSISRDILITIKFKRIVVFPPLEPFSSSKVTGAVSFFICRRRSIRANAASRPVIFTFWFPLLPYLHPTLFLF